MKPDSETVINMTKMDEEIMSPYKFLRLTKEQRMDISTVVPVVKKLGSVNVDNSDFVSLLVKWKTPKYEVSF